jgi:hypothetical protein
VRRTSHYFNLQYIVLCQPLGQPFFESIAAFNASVIAIDYAKEAFGKMQGLCKYRVIERRHNEEKCIYRSDDR